MFIVKPDHYGDGLFVHASFSPMILSKIAFDVPSVRVPTSISLALNASRRIWSVVSNGMHQLLRTMYRSPFLTLSKRISGIGKTAESAIAAVSEWWVSVRQTYTYEDRYQFLASGPRC